MELHNAHVVKYFQGQKGWHDEVLNADHWAVLSDVAPTDAAMLLCHHNPNESSFDALSNDATGSTSYETPINSGMVAMAYTPKHLRMLAGRLVDKAKADHKPRTLRDWHQTARGMGLTYHSWIDGYMEATAPAKNATPAPADANGKKWTPENLAALKAYRETHTMAETAAHFQISAQRIRILLPSMKPAKKGYSAFTHHIK